MINDKGVKNPLIIYSRYFAPARFFEMKDVVFKNTVMRNFFKTRVKTSVTDPSHREIVEILDTDEDRVINQYKRYLNYINRVKKELMQKSADIVGYRKKIQFGNS